MFETYKYIQTRSNHLPVLTSASSSALRMSLWLVSIVMMGAASELHMDKWRKVMLLYKNFDAKNRCL